MPVIAKGLEGIVANSTHLSSVQGQDGRLIYEGYEIGELAGKATFEEVEANGFNLNIPRYVDTFEPEPEVDLQAVQNEIRDLEKQLAETREKMNFYLKELGINV